MSDAKEKSEQESGLKDEGKPVRIEYVFPENQNAAFANHALVQNEGHEVYISFFDIRPPILTGTQEEKQKQLDELDSVQATCVARIVMSTGRIQGLIGALDDQLQKALNRVSMNTEQRENDSQ